MQYFRYLFKFASALVILAILLFLVIQEFYLVKAKNQLLADLAELNKISSAPKTYQDCLSLSGALAQNQSDIAQFQLRFLSDSEYVLEYLCVGFEFAPQLIKQDKLPPGVYKLPGSSGFLLGAEWSHLALGFTTQPWGFDLPQCCPLSRTKSISLQSNRVISSADLGDNQPIWPKTNCAGYGYFCCDPANQLAEGQQRPATDCPQNCFESCFDQASITNFSARDFDQYSRTLNLANNSLAEFYYQVQHTGTNQLKIKIDFGDGHFWLGQLSDQSVTHSYSCSNNSSCNYTATIQLLDSTLPRGSMIENNAVSPIRIVVR